MTTVWMIIDVILALGVTVRLTRAITVEDIGGRLLRWPANRWMNRATPENRWKREWWADALSCPFCVSVHVGIAGFAIMAIAHSTDSWFTIVWRIVAAGLTASYVGAHLMVAFGDTDDTDEYDEEASTSVG